MFFFLSCLYTIASFRRLPTISGCENGKIRLFIITESHAFKREKNNSNIINGEEKRSFVKPDINQCLEIIGGCTQFYAEEKKNM